MDILSELKGKPSKAKINKVVSYVGSDTTRFSKLISILLKEEGLLKNRIVWVLSYVIQNHPVLMTPKHLMLLVKEANKRDAHDAIKRNIIRALQYVNIPRKNQGVVAQLCFQFLETAKEPVAVKAFSITVLANITKENPEMKRELILLIQEQLPHSSAAFVSRAKRIISELTLLKTINHK